MKKDKLIDPDRPGRRSGIRRLIYRPAPGRKKERDDGPLPPPPDWIGGSRGGKGGKQRWQDGRDWPTIKDQLRRTLRGAPEVVINVRGSRKAGASETEAIEGVRRYMLYISRDGKLLTVDEKGDRIAGVDAVRDKHAAWDLDMMRHRGAKDAPLHPSFNIVFSMPSRTDPDKLLASVEAFSREHFAGHQYVMALHTPETEPGRKKDKSPEHPHVHVIVRAEDDAGQRLHIRKGTLRIWREAFAAELRARGIEANATSRAERGSSFKQKSPAEWHIQKRLEKERAEGREPTTRNLAREARFLEAAKELQEGRTEPKPWELAMEARRRDVLRDLAQNAARLREEGDVELADQVDTFMRNMPALDTERRQMQRALIEQVKRRIQERDQGRAEDQS
jgi:hypothetical protein